MIENRPIVAISIGYIIGIISGLYCKNSIVLFFLLILFFSKYKKPHKAEFKLISAKRYFRYIKIIFTKKVCILILISSVISNAYMFHIQTTHKLIENKFDNKTVTIEGIVISNIIEKKYKVMYKIRIKSVLKIGGQKNNINKNVYISIKKNLNYKCEYGDKITLTGTFSKGKTRTNYKGFDYREYLENQGLYGIIDAQKIETSKNESFLWNIKKKINNISNSIKALNQRNFSKENASVINGILLGDTQEMDENTKEDFSESNILHIVAVSGMHVGYIVLMCKCLFENILGKRKAYFLSIVFLLFYMTITGFTASVVRATIMATFILFSKIIYRKSDIWTNLGLSIIVLLVVNPYSIRNAGLLLSYMGTIGIIIYSKINKTTNIIGVTLAVAIFILPISSLYTNKIPILSLAISMIISLLVAPIILLGFIFIILCVLLSNATFLVETTKFILEKMIDILLNLASLGSCIPLNKIYTITPNFLKIFVYYVFVFSIVFIYKIYKPSKIQNTVFNKRMKSIISLTKYKYNQNKTKVISFCLVIILLVSSIKASPSKLKIYFIDVGQGDSSLIVTPMHKKILIDGGGSEEYDVGKNILLPYLLDRGIKSLDYVIISHFDTDHVGGILYLMENIKIKNIVISKQFETSKNLEKFNSIIKNRKINIQIVQAGDKINIEKNLYFYILWPVNSKMLTENPLNNNSLVCKLKYNSFSMLFTGDIEEMAEKEIVKMYSNKNLLNSIVLKVAHHGSKSSSTKDFLDLIKPKFALIGVGENNMYGHPNDEIIQRLISLRH